MNTKDKSDLSSLDLDRDTVQIDETLEQPTYDAMMKALEVKDWTNYYILSARWYAMFKARRTEAKSVIDPNPPARTDHGFP